MAGSGSTTERGKGADLGTLLWAPPDYSKIAFGNSLTFEGYVSSGVVEVPEMANCAHVLILRTGSPSVIEWRSNGRDRRVELAPGSVPLLPAGLRRAATVFRPLPGVGSILQIQPAFFNRGIGEIARSGKVELIWSMDLNDGQISRLMESLREDTAAGSPSGSLFAGSVAMAFSAHIAQRYSTLTTKLEPYRGGL